MWKRGDQPAASITTESVSLKPRRGWGLLLCEIPQPQRGRLFQARADRGSRSPGRQRSGSGSGAGNGCVPCACIPLARARSCDHTPLQGRLGSVVQACAQAEAEDLGFGERLGVCERVEYVGLLLSTANEGPLSCRVQQGRKWRDLGEEGGLRFSQARVYSAS